jgi:hypothetical protein
MENKNGQQKDGKPKVFYFEENKEMENKNGKQTTTLLIYK